MINLPSLFEGLAAFQYLILFLTVIVEGPIATVVAGFFIGQETMNFFLVYPIVVVADLVGDVIYYSLGRWKGKIGLRFLGLNEGRLKEIKAHFDKNCGKTILLSKLAHGVGTVILFAAGVARVKFDKFLLYNVVGTIPKSAILIVIGYFFGHSVRRIQKYFDLFGLVTLAIGLILLVVYLRFTKKMKKKEEL